LNMDVSYLAPKPQMDAAADGANLSELSCSCHVGDALAFLD